MIAGIIRQLAKCVPRCSVIEKLKTMWHRLLLLASPVVAGIAHCLLASRIVSGTAHDCWHRLLLLTSRVVPEIGCYCWHCAWSLPSPVLSHGVAATAPGCWHRVLLLASPVIASIACGG